MFKLERAVKIKILWHEVWKKFRRTLPLYHQMKELFHFAKLTDGVTGNTSDFGSEESRFEP